LIFILYASSFTDKLKYDIPESCQTITLLSPNEK